MGFTRTCSFLVGVVLASSSAVRAQDSQPVRRDLQFEVVKEPQSPRPSPVATPSRVPPTHVAVFETPEPVKWLGKVNYSNLKNGIFHTPAGKSASPEQKAYQTSNFIRMDFPANRPYAGPISRIEISSPSEDDARKMVEAFLQWTDQAAAEERADKEASLKRAREWLAAAEKDLPELQPRLDAAKAERENLEKVIAYSGAEDATKDILELDKALRSVEIDLTVARAKQKAINNLLNTAQYPTGRELINQMLAAQDIELAGALARKSALEAERAKAVHYRDLVRQIEKDGKRLRELTSYRMEGGNKITPIVSQQQRIAELEGELAEIKPLTVAGDKITLYRVGPDAAGSQPARPPGGN